MILKDMAFKWRTHPHSWSSIPDVNFVKEINKEEKTFCEQGICSVDYTLKESKGTVSPSPFV